MLDAQYEQHILNLHTYVRMQFREIFGSCVSDDK